jgi:hypothetical protein
MAIDPSARKIKVHYMGWHSRWDAWHSLDAAALGSALSIAPLFSKVPNWRTFRVGETVEMKVSDKWVLAVVECVDNDSGQVQLRLGPRDAADDHGDHWLPFWRSAPRCIVVALMSTGDLIRLCPAHCTGDP